MPPKLLSVWAQARDMAKQIRFDSGGAWRFRKGRVSRLSFQFEGVPRQFALEIANLNLRKSPPKRCEYRRVVRILEQKSRKRVVLCDAVVFKAGVGWKVRVDVRRDLGSVPGRQARADLILMALGLARRCLYRSGKRDVRGSAFLGPRDGREVELWNGRDATSIVEVYPALFA